MKENKQIEEMAKCCPYYHKRECCADATDISKCDLMCEMFGVFANLEVAGYRKQKWISVEERLPESTRMVLCYTPCDGFVFVGYYQKIDHLDWKSPWKIITAMRSTKNVTKKVTHWMPLPQPPKGE